MCHPLIGFFMQAHQIGSDVNKISMKKKIYICFKYLYTITPEYFQWETVRFQTSCLSLGKITTRRQCLSWNVSSQLANSWLVASPTYWMLLRIQNYEIEDILHTFSIIQVSFSILSCVSKVFTKNTIIHRFLKWWP